MWGCESKNVRLPWLLETLDKSLAQQAASHWNVFTAAYISVFEPELLLL